MALLHAEMYFPSLHRSVPLQVILPVDKRNPDGTLIGPKKFKTLYLLHGLVGSCGDWVSHTRILRWAQQLELAVVMPSGDNSFYVDRPVTQNNYGQFIGQELVEMTRRMFPLSDKREDTFLAGLSMGGFGALRNGLKYYETFGYVASLSGAVDILADCPADPGALAMGEALFGPAEEALASDKNPRVLIRQLGQAKKQDPTLALPKLYLCCGTEDFLLQQNRTCKALLEEAGFDLTYVEGPGNHDWDFWDTYIQKILAWLPLK